VGKLTVPKFLRANGVLRAWVAIAAAYVFVLQLLLTGIVATQMAAAPASPTDPFAICYSGGTPPNGEHKGELPLGAHQTCVICAIASIVPLSTAVSHSIVIAFNSTVAFQAPTGPLFIADRTRVPRTSRGPPQTA